MPPSVPDSGVGCEVGCVSTLGVTGAGAAGASLSLLVVSRLYKELLLGTSAGLLSMLVSVELVGD